MFSRLEWGHEKVKEGGKNSDFKRAGGRKKGRVWSTGDINSGGGTRGEGHLRTLLLEDTKLIQSDRPLVRCWEKEGERSFMKTIRD